MMSRDLRTITGATKLDTRMMLGRIMGRLAFDSIAEAQAATIPADVSTTELKGAYRPGDAGLPMIAKRVDGQPTLHAGWFRSTDRYMATASVLPGGHFDDGDVSFWTLTGASAISNGKLNVGPGIGNFEQEGLTPGVLYNFSMNLNVTSAVRLRIRTTAGGAHVYLSPNLVTGPQTISGSFIADGTLFRVEPDGDWYVGSVDDVVVAPASGGAVTSSAYGGYWEYVCDNQVLYTEWFGGKNDLYIMNRANGTAIVNSSAVDNKAATEKAAAFLMSAPRGNCPIGPTLQYGYGGYYFSDTPNFDRGVCVQGMGQGYQNTQTRLVFASGKAGLFFRQMQGGTGSQSTVRDLELHSLGYGGQTDKHGITMKCPVYVDNCSITGFGGNGIDISSDVNLGTGANCFTVKHCVIFENKVDGIFIYGGDSNAGHTDSCSFIANGEWAIRDKSFLANAHHGHHASTNGNLRTQTGGPYYAEGINGPTTFIGCYSEGDMMPSYAGNLTTFIGGLHGSFVICDGGVWQMGRQWAGGMQLEPNTANRTADNCFFRLRSGGPNTLMQFGSGRDAFEGLPIDLRYFSGVGFLFQYANSDGDLSLGFTPGEGSVWRNPRIKANNILLPKGFLYGGNGGDEMRRFTCSRFGGGPLVEVGVRYLPGDVCVDDAANSMGWICSTEGITTDTNWVSGTVYNVGQVVRMSSGKAYQLKRRPYDPDAWSMPGSTVKPTHTTPDQIVAYPEPNPQIDPGEASTIPGYSWRVVPGNPFTDWIWHSGQVYIAHQAYVWVPGPDICYEPMVAPVAPTPIFNQVWSMPGSTIQPTHTGGDVEYPEPNPSPSGSEPSTIPGYVWTYITSNGSAVWSRIGQRYIPGSVTHNSPSLAAGEAGADVTIDAPGAVMGDFVKISCSIDLPGISIVNARISAVDTAKFRLQNITGGALDPASATFYACVDHR